MSGWMKLAGALALATGATMASAEDATLRTADHNGARELSRGDYARAERVLAASLKVSPRDADLLLNQALLLQRTGRADEARAVFRLVLAQADETVVMGHGATASAHALARTGLSAGSATVVAAR